MFSKLIGDVSPEKKAELWGGFIMLMEHAIESGAKGVSEGAVKSIKENH